MTEGPTVSREVARRLILAREEIARVLRLVLADSDAHGCQAKTHPPRYARLLWARARNEPLNDDTLTEGSGWVLRHIHDFYGWMAKHTAKKKGVCAGALYRTHNYLMLDERMGGKYDPLPKNVHIEHTTPACMLERSILCYADALLTPSDLQRHLMQFSVCTAMTQEESKSFKAYGVSDDEHPEFNPSAVNLDARPFARYFPLKARNDFVVYNVMTGLPVKMETFTYRDHLKALRDASALVLEGSCDTYSLYHLNVLTGDRLAPAR